MVSISTWDGWVDGFHTSKMEDASNGWIGGGFHIQAAPVSKSSRALAPTAPQSPVTLTLAPFTITKQKKEENNHNVNFEKTMTRRLLVYLPSLDIALSFNCIRREQLWQENEEEKNTNKRKHNRNHDQHHHHHHHRRVKELIVLL